MVKMINFKLNRFDKQMQNIDCRSFTRVAPGTDTGQYMQKKV